MAEVEQPAKADSAAPPAKPASDSTRPLSMEDRVAQALGYGSTQEPQEDDSGDDAPTGDDYDDGDDTPAPSADPNEGEAPPAAYEVVEVDGREYQVPPELKPYLLREADYTKKTQEVADRARVWDTHFAAANAQREFEQSVSAELEQLRGLQGQLAQFKQVDLDSLDGTSLTRLIAKRDELREAASDLKSTLDAKYAQHKSTMDGRRSELMTHGVKYLQRHVPGWGPETAKTVIEQARLEGFAKHQVDALDNMTDPMAPVTIKLLAKAAKWDQLQAQTSSAVKKAQAAPPVVRPNASNPEMTAKMSKLAFRKQIKNAKTDGEKHALILRSLEKRFGG